MLPRVWEEYFFYSDLNKDFSFCVVPCMFRPIIRVIHLRRTFKRSHSTSFLHRSSCFQTPITTIHINRPSCAALSDTINKKQAINHAMGQRIPPTTPGLGDLTIRARFNRITAAISEKHVLHSVYKGYEVYILTNNYSMQSHARYDSHNRVCGLP